MADPGSEPAGETFESAAGSRATEIGGPRYAAIIESAPDCIITTDHAGRVTEFNPAAERILGHRRIDVLGKRLWDVILPPSRRPADADAFARHLTSESMLVLGTPTQVSAVRADGSEVTVELAITRTTLDGQASFIVCAHDITDRTRAQMDAPYRRELDAEQARRARDTALRAEVYAVLARAVSMRDTLQGCAEALVKHLDAAFARIWTLRRGSDVLELRASAGAYTRLDGRYAHVSVGHLKIGQIARDRLPYLTNDVSTDARIEDKEWARREGIVAFAGYPLVVDERVVGVMAMFARHQLEAATLDTLQSVAAALAQGVERKRAEEHLQRSEAYLAEGQRLTHTGSWAWHLDTGEIFFSAEMFRIYGFEPADRPPPYEVILQRAHPDDAPNVDRAVTEALRSGTELRLLTRICIPGQPMKWVETYGHPVREDGRVVEFIGTVVDVTERVRAGRRRRRSIKARYEAVLAERTRIARDMHDGILQELASIALQLGAVLPHIPGDEVAERVRHILALTERTARETRRAVLDMREREDSVDLAKAVQDAAHRAAAHAALELSVGTSGAARPVAAPVRDAVVSIVHEAVTNVRKHAGARSIAVSIAFGRRTCRVSVHDDGRGLTIPVGVGDDTAHMGLVGMRERAAKIGATLRVSTTPGRGTVVKLVVPFDR